MIQCVYIKRGGAYAFHISLNHAFIDGNKRTALKSIRRVYTLHMSDAPTNFSGSQPLVEWFLGSVNTKCYSQAVVFGFKLVILREVPAALRRREELRYATNSKIRLLET